MCICIKGDPQIRFHLSFFLNKKRDFCFRWFSELIRSILIIFDVLNRHGLELLIFRIFEKIHLDFETIPDRILAYGLENDISVKYRLISVLKSLPGIDINHWKCSISAKNVVVSY